MLPPFIRGFDGLLRLVWVLGLAVLLVACRGSSPGQIQSAVRVGDPCDPATFQQVCGSASTVLFCHTGTKTVTEVACSGTEPVCTSVVVENGTNYPPTHSGCVPFACPHAPYCQDEYNLWFCREGQLHLAHSARGGDCVGTTSVSCLINADGGVQLRMRDEAASFGKFCGTHACALGTCFNVAETAECVPVCLDSNTVGRRCDGFPTRFLQTCAQGTTCGQAWPEYYRTQCWPTCTATTSPTCDGNILRTCTNNIGGSQTGLILVSRDCANEGMVCGNNPLNGRNDCLPGDPGTTSMREVEFNGLLHPYFANKIWKSGLPVIGTISYGAPSTPAVPSQAASDVDYYYLTLPANTRLTVDLDVPADADFDVMLRYSSGVPLTGSLNGPGLDEKVTYVNSLSSSMDVYIQVFGKEGSSSSTPYTLVATMTSFAGGCAPTQCNVQGSNCGAKPDGCGGELLCGPTCLHPSTCGGGGVTNRCGSACTTYKSCDIQGKNCGTVSDGCGGTLDCGVCPAGQTCGGGGVPNVCGPGPCTPTSCAAQGKNCGTISDGCGNLLDCGTCPEGQVCGIGGTPNVCASCTPTTCAVQGKNCGTIPDGCGGALDCGTCTAPQTCGGGGTPNVCGCTPTTCAAQGKNCGTISNGCGGTLDCGTCTAPQTCGGGGTPNVCGASTATLTLTATGRSGESVFSEPSGLSVSVGQTGSASFAVGTQITLRATNNRDVVWSGVCSSGGAKTKSCTFTLNANASETADVK